jgi:hypothetical protein
VIAYLSDEWVAALDTAVRDDHALSELAREAPLVIEQVVTGTPNGERTFHVTLRREAIGARSGPAAEPTIRLTTDYRTASAIARGVERAQAAFLDGRIRVGGDISVLVEARASLARIDDVTAPLRRDTTF